MNRTYIEPLIELETDPSLTKEKCRLLLIEDNMAHVFLVQQLIKHIPELDIELQHAPTMGEGLEECKLFNPDVILLDLGLPDCDGLEGIDHIRTWNPAVPIIVLTSQVESKYAMDALDRGAQDYLRKGEVTALTLARTIRYAKERQKHTAQLLESAHEQYRLQLQVNGERYIRNLVSDIQHELRTPLAIIQTSADLIQRVDNAELAARKHTQITDSVDRLTNIADYLSILTQLTCNDAGFIADPATAEGLKEKLDERCELEPRIRLDLAPEFRVELDLQRLMEILDRLICNAIRYSENDVTVQTTVQNDMLNISVIDQGIGIAESDLNSIFLPFFKLDDSRTARNTKKSEGGLGLSIAKAIAMSCGVEIAVESTLGDGSTFSLQIPLAKPHDSELPIWPYGYSGD